MYVPGLGSGGRESDCDMRSANGSAGLAIGTPAAEDLFFAATAGGVSSLTLPSEEVRLSVWVVSGVESEPLPEALRARRDGGLLAAPRDLVCGADNTPSRLEHFVSYYYTPNIYVMCEFYIM